MRTRGRPAPTGTAGANSEISTSEDGRDPQAIPAQLSQALATPLRFVPKRSKPQCAHGDAPNAKHRPAGKRNVHTATSRRWDAAPQHGGPQQQLLWGRATHTTTRGRIPAPRKSTAGPSTGRKEVQGGGENEGEGASV